VSHRGAPAVIAFGVDAIVLPPDTEWFNHLYTRQDELYFGHAGTAGFEVDGETARWSTRPISSGGGGSRRATWTREGCATEAASIGS